MQRIENLDKQIVQTSSQQQNLTEIAFEDEGKIAIVYMNSKKDLNALTLNMRNELIRNVEYLDKNPQVKIILLMSKLPKVFCAGANIREFEKVSYESLSYDDVFQPMDHLMNFTKKPMIAAINGVAFGGGFEVPLGCDMIVLREDAKLGLPEINLGLMPGWGGTQRLTRLIGRQNAARYILSGEPMTAQQALEYGIAVQIFKKETFQEDVIKFAKKFSSKALHTLVIAKKAIRASENTTLQEGLNYERSVFSPLHNTVSKQEGVSAFTNKRKANFSNL